MEKHPNSLNTQSATESDNDITKKWDTKITTVINCLNVFCELNEFGDDCSICVNIINWIYSTGLNNFDDICNLMSDDMYSNLIYYLDDFLAYSNGLIIQCNIVQKHLLDFKKESRKI